VVVVVVGAEPGGLQAALEPAAAAGIRLRCGQP